MKKYSPQYTITKDGTATIRFEKSVRRIKHVKKVVLGCDNDFCAILHKNGRLCAWGFNGRNILKDNNQKFIKFEDRVLIAKDVKDVTSYDFSLLYLTKDNKAYFKGYADIFGEGYYDRMM